VTTAAPRPVGPIALFALGVNGIVGVGIFFVPQEVGALVPGKAGISVFALTALALAPVALVFATLGRRFEVDGGPVVFARAAFGDAPSFFVGWLAYVSAILSCSAVVSGLATATAPALGLDRPPLLAAAKAVLVTVLALVVASGISISARAWTTLTALKLLPLLALVALFVPAASAAASWPAGQPASADAWARAVLVAVFACQGFEIVPVIAGQVRDAARIVPLATVGSLVAACLLYVGLMAACVSTLPGLASSRQPLADAAALLGGQGFGRLVAVGTSVSALGISFGMMVTTPRYLSALAAGGRRLFDLDRFAPSGVPLRALAATWLLVLLAVEAGDLSSLFALSSLAVLIQFGVTAAALFALAARRDRGLRPAHAALAVPALAFAAYVASRGATRNESLSFLAAAGLGGILFALSRPRAEA
jgi:amino acid transporter